MMNDCVARFHNTRDFSVLDGKRIKKIDGLYSGSECITFECYDGTMYKMYHQQDGSENVFVSDVYAIDAFGNVITSQERQQNFINGETIYTLKPTDYSNVSEHYISDIPQDWAPKELVVLAKSLHIYEIRTQFMSLHFTWTGIALDDETSTEVDVVQIAGEGMWIDGD